MESVFFGSRPALARAASTAIAALMTLTIGVAFNIRGGAGASTYIDTKHEVVTCTDTGGMVKYNYCNWQEPQGDSGSGSVVTRLFYSAGKVPVSFVVDGTIGKSSTASGSFAIPNFTHITVNTGTTVYMLSGALMVDSGSYIRLMVPSTNPTTTHTASMAIEYYTRLSR